MEGITHVCYKTDTSVLFYYILTIYVLGEFFCLFVLGDFRGFFLSSQVICHPDSTFPANIVMFANFPRVNKSLRVIEIKVNGTQIMR